MQPLFSYPAMRTLAGLTLAAATIALLAVAFLALATIDKTDMPTTISVTGEGEVFAVPDVGQFTYSVRAEAETAAEAQALSGAAINDILAYLEAEGVAETDIKTISYNLWPRYRWEEQVCPVGSICRGGEQVQDGFEVNQEVRVKVRDVAAASSIIAGVGERGATNLSGLNFVVDDTTALETEARSNAIADAAEKAEILAGELGVRIVKVAGFYEEQGYYEPMMYEARAMSMDVAEEAGFGGASLPTGENKTTARVTVMYEIK